MQHGLIDGHAVTSISCDALIRMGSSLLLTQGGTGEIFGSGRDLFFRLALLFRQGENSSRGMLQLGVSGYRTLHHADADL